MKDKLSPCHSPPVIALNIALARMRFVGPDNHLDEAMAHDIFVGEIDELDAFYIGEDTLGFDEAAALSGREIDLGYVAGDDGLGAEADARQEHLHLLAGSILRLV